MKKIKRVILITVDALRSDHVGYNNPKLRRLNISPHLDWLAQRSVVFNQAFSAGPYTKASFPGIFFASYPNKVTEKLSEELGWGKIKKEAKSWVKLLGEAGFKTAGYTTNPYIGRLMGYDRYFEEFDDRDRPFTFLTRQYFPKLDKKLKALLIDRILKRFGPTALMDSPYINTLAFDWLNRESRKPFFLWLHYMDCHGPYYGNLRPAQVVKKEIAFDKKKMLRGYRKSIQFFDQSFGCLLRHLKEKGLLNQTLIVVTSDHGELFGEHGQHSHPGAFYEESIHVPFFIYYPGLSPKRINSLASLIDLGPTILDLLGLEKSPQAQGRSLKSLLRDPKAKPIRKIIISEFFSPEGSPQTGYPANYAVRDSHYKLTLFLRRGEKRLYDLKKDPQEEKNIYYDQPKTVQRLKEEFKKEYLG